MKISAREDINDNNIAPANSSLNFYLVFIFWTNGIKHISDETDNPVKQYNIIIIWINTTIIET